MTTEKYYRNCPRCNEQIQYTVKGSWYNAKRNKSTCLKCQREKCSMTLKRKHKSGELEAPKRKPDHYYDKKFFRDCPECRTLIGYTTKKQMKYAASKGSICNSCSNVKYKKGMQYKQTEETIKQMRASKAGFDSFEEYEEKYPKKQLYRNEVWKYTYRNDLESMDKWEKRGRCGVEGAYQLDHIISINEGWKKDIPAEEIGNMENLQMIPWRQNLSKSSS